MKLILVASTLFTVFVISGCSESEPEPQKPSTGNVWKSQTDTIQHTKDVAAGLEQSLQQREQKINQ